MYAYVAWTAKNATSLSFLKGSALPHIAAAALTLGIAPFTLLIMVPTNSKLMAKADKAVDAKASSWSTTDDQEVSRLVDTWTTLNAIRSLFPLAGFIVGAFAALG